MKVGGVKVTSPAEELLVIPRGEQRLVFRATAIEWDDYNQACPPPEPPVTLGKGGEKIAHLNDETYKHQLEQQQDRRIAYMVIRSLEPSQIEWETVDRDDPKTWLNYEKELTDSGLVPIEINRIVQTCMDANQLSETKLQEAREAFLLGRAVVSSD